MNKNISRIALSVMVMTMGSFGLMAMDNNMCPYDNPVDNPTMPRTQNAGLTGVSVLQIENTRLLAQLEASNEITSLKVENAKLQAHLTASTTEISILRELLAELRKANEPQQQVEHKNDTSPALTAGLKQVIEGSEWDRLSPEDKDRYTHVPGKSRYKLNS